jgi:hypothetical protein
MAILRRIETQICAVIGLPLLLSTVAGCSSKAAPTSASSGTGGGGMGSGDTGTGGSTSDQTGSGGSGATGGSSGGSSSTSKGSGGSTSSSRSGSTGGTGAQGSSEGGEGGDDSGATASCPASALSILFKPMYSAYDGVHTFQIPAVVNGIDPSAVAIDWSASDPSMVDLETDPTTGGVMITTRKAGKVSIIASAGGLCGTSLLTITAATAQDWEDGSARYNDGVVINRLPVTRPMGGGGGATGAAGGGNVGPGAAGNGAAGNGAAGSAGASATEAACTNCHGDTASGPFKTVQHTPEQTGGFSDSDLINIFTNGVVPTGGYFDTTIVSYAEWQSFHKWNVGDNPQAVVVYLRSLTPEAQTGSANFGGRFMNGGAGGRMGFGGAGGRQMGRGGFPNGGVSNGGASSGGASSGGAPAAGTDAGGAATTGGAAATAGDTSSGGAPSQGGTGGS